MMAFVASDPRIHIWVPSEDKLYARDVNGAYHVISTCCTSKDCALSLCEEAPYVGELRCDPADGRVTGVAGIKDRGNLATPYCGFIRWYEKKKFAEATDAARPPLLDIHFWIPREGRVFARREVQGHVDYVLVATDCSSADAAVSRSSRADFVGHLDAYGYDFNWLKSSLTSPAPVGVISHFRAWYAERVKSAASREATLPAADPYPNGRFVIADRQVWKFTGIASGSACFSLMPSAIHGALDSTNPPPPGTTLILIETKIAPWSYKVFVGNPTDAPELYGHWLQANAERLGPVAAIQLPLPEPLNRQTPPDLPGTPCGFCEHPALGRGFSVPMCGSNRCSRADFLFGERLRAGGIQDSPEARQEVLRFVLTEERGITEMECAKNGARTPRDAPRIQLIERPSLSESTWYKKVEEVPAVGETPHFEWP